MWAKRSDMIVHEQDPYNAEPPRSGLAEAITPQNSFYVRNHGPVPEPDLAGWRLSVGGMVERALEISLTDLQRRWPQHSVVATMQCAGNRRAGLIEVRDIPGEDPWGPGATSTALWTGVRLRDVLAEAGVREEARYVAFGAPDVSQLADPPQQYGGSIDLAKATSGEVLLAWQMNDAPLPRVHGAPVRVVVPGYIGARSVKWVDQILVQDVPSANYFQATAYRLLPAEADPTNAGPGDGLALAAVALNADIVSPEDHSQVAAGPVQVSGYAYAGQDRTVARVDVSVNDGVTWAQAELDDAQSSWAWQHWRASMELTPGQCVLTARAWDSSGASQPESPRHLWNPKGYVNNSWARVEVEVV
ncbi:sulfite oxidase [Allobranchiibius sp. CTAmp26]|uniref:sulfite oxidase n=1 Tax=Allobranchiibius sp. CTAmp26 TaxID=2815214 RepID=UPI001AA18FE1|nr:sulfite oxidase [Allobranchiibius sp. CTAmp26]MBO1756351.1 sulfite oxidase [Allobranchiibius sp. CTAmp26]